MGFIEGRIAEEKLFGDVVFPKTLLPSAGSDGNLANLVRADREALIAALDRHRALLFRGFHVNSVDDFELAVEAFGWEAYQVPVGTTTRAKLSDRIYSANEASPEHLINFHHEMAIRPNLPSKIFFYCSEPSPEGGETSVVPSDVVVQKMEERMPEFMAKAAEHGVVFRFKMASDEEADSGAVISKSWKSSFGTHDEAKAAKRARELYSCSSIRFLEGGRAELSFGPLNPIGVFRERRVWLVPLLGYTATIENVSNSFGDGSSFPEEAVGIYREFLEENSVDVKWQKGDVLLLDNLAVQHARRPGKPPRRILASMCK